MTLAATQDRARHEGGGIAPAQGSGRVRSGSQAIGCEQLANTKASR